MKVTRNDTHNSNTHEVRDLTSQYLKSENEIKSSHVEGRKSNEADRPNFMKNENTQSIQ